MLRASAHDENGRRTLIIGLQPENIERLRAGDPIVFNANEVGVDCDVIVFAGGTPEEMARQLGADVLSPEGTLQ